MLRDEVFDWLSQQPDWQQDLARRLVSQVELQDEEYSEVLSLIKAHFGATVDGPTPQPQRLARENLSTESPGEPARLLKFGALRGVGLVAEDGELTFAPEGLTIIYGQNAAGKSSYVRGLKVLCRTVDRDCRVRGNIYAQGSGSSVPSAYVEFQVDDSITARRAPLDGSSEVTLPGISVFDSACAELYLSSSNTIQFVPTELLLLTRLASVQDRLRRDLDAESTALYATKPSIAAYSSTTVVGRALATLIDSTYPLELSSLATLTDENQARLEELRGIIATAAASTTREDA